jgi:ribonuclease P/MRP protein subunit POP5
MSVRPPTLREKRRYILAKIEPCGAPVEGKDLYYAIHEAATSLWGDVVVAAMQPAVIAIEKGYAILRCRRGTEREYATSLSTITVCRENRIALRIIATSGTIDSLRDRIKERGTNVMLSGEITSMNSCDISGSSGTEPLEQNMTQSPETGDSIGSTSTASRDCTYDTRVYQIVHCDGHKVDVIEKGFKNTHLLFLTTADLEER